MMFEDQLLQVINRRLPYDDQVRLDYFREQNESGEITEVEHQELLAFVLRVENEDAERAAAILQLSQIRHVNLSTCLGELIF
jgi:hypothetical protein